MSYSLNTLILDPHSKKSENAVILCHGYGGNGKAISPLATYWRNYLTETVFCPDAPEVCAINPSGFQWYDLGEDSSDTILAKSLVAEIKLNKFIDDVKKNLGLSSNKIAIGGFSQGSMISLQTGLKEDKISIVLLDTQVKL